MADYSFGSLAPMAPPDRDAMGSIYGVRDGLAQMQFPSWYQSGFGELSPSPFPDAPPSRQDQAFQTSIDRWKQLAKDVFFAPSDALKAFNEQPTFTNALGIMPMGGIGKAAPKAMRLYRGETNLPQSQALPEWLRADPNVQATVDATGRWFTPELDVAKYYNRTFGDKSGRVSFVDVPAADAEKWLSANQPDARRFSAVGRDREEYFLPRELANTRKPYNE